MTAKPPKTRQAALEDRKRAAGLMRVCDWLPKAEVTDAKAAGLVRVCVWADPADAPSIREHAAKLAKRRAKLTAGAKV